MQLVVARIGVNQCQEGHKCDILRALILKLLNE
jgi:hypothetical protein